MSVISGRMPNGASDGAARLGERLKTWTWSSGVTLSAILVGELVFFSVRAPDFLTGGNFVNAGVQSAVYAVVAVGTTFGLVSGALDISIGSTIGLTGVVLTRVATAGRPAWESIGLCLLTGLAVGCINGIVVVKLRVNPIVATLGMLGIARGLAYILSGTSFIATTSSVGDSTFGLLQHSTYGVPRSIPFALFMLVAGYVLLHRTRFGRYAFAIGRDPDAARALALPVDGLRIIYLALSGFCAGLAGWVFASTGDGAAGNAAIGYELTVITAIVMGGAGLAGGTGSMIGTGLAVLVLGLLVNGMSLMGAPIFYELVIPGIFLLVAVSLDSLRTGGYR